MIPFEEGEIVEALALIVSKEGRTTSWRLMTILEVDNQNLKVRVRGGDNLVAEFESWIDYGPEWFRHLRN